MTNKEIDNLAIQRGFKTGDLKKLVRRGYADAGAAKPRATGFLGGPKATAAYNAGFELFAEQKRPRLEPGEHKIRIGDKDIVVVLNRAKKSDGYEATLPIAGGTSVVAGDTAETTLAAARKRLTEAAAEFAKDPITAVYDRDVEIGGKKQLVHVTKRKSAKLRLVSAEHDELRWEGRDEEAGLREMAAKITAKLARTVDGAEAKVVQGNGRAKQTTFLRLDPVKLASDLAAAEDDIAAKKEEAKPYTDALEHAKKRKETLIAQLIAAGHEAQPEKREKAGAAT